jgi:hypothetical protein
LLLTKTAGAEADRWGQWAALPASTNGQVYIASAYVNVGTGCTVTLRIDKQAGVGIFQSEEITQTSTTGWVRIETPALTANATADAMFLYLFITGTPTVLAYIDALQVELLGYVTTYCDGTQDGCEWNGTGHNSTSTRSALSRAGGRVYDLTDDYSFYVTGYIDSGVAPLTQHLDEYAIIPGGEISSYKVHPRVITLLGFMYDRDSFSDLHDLVQALIDVLKPDAVPGNQPVLLRYTEATVTKEIAVHYEAGLEGNYRGRWNAQQNFAIRFLAADPYWYEIGESAAVLDTNDQLANTQLAFARLRSTGNWDDLGPPNAAGTYTDGLVVAIGPDKTVYYGGDFLNFDNIANADYIVSYNPSTETWAALGTGCNGIVRAIVFAPDGDMFVGGDFAQAGGVANTAKVARWDGAAWNALGVGLNGNVRAMAIDNAGLLYIGGLFTDVVGGPGGTYDRIVSWNGAAYAAVGAGMNATVYSLAVDRENLLFVGGAFTDISGGPGGTYNRIATWNGAAYAALGTGTSGAVYTTAFDRSNVAHIGGTFATADGVTVNNIAKWTGVTFVELDGGTDNDVNCIALAPDGSLIVVGLFGTAGDIAWAAGLARWGGSAWSHLDADCQFVGYSWVAIGSPDPVVLDNYDLWLANLSPGTLDHSGSLSMTVDGSTSARPVIYVSRTGGTSARLEQIRNETTGKALYLNHDLLDGEQIIIDISQQTVTSSFFGNRSEALLFGSDFATFELRSGANQITAYVSVVGAPTITAYMVYRDKYWSID